MFRMPDIFQAVRVLIVFSFQSCPAGKTAVNAPDSVAMLAFHSRRLYKDFSGLVTIHAPCSLAMTAPGTYVFILGFVHPVSTLYYSEPEPC